MPLLRRRWGIANPFDGTSFAAHILEEDQIILQRISAKNEIVAVELQIEDDAGGLIDAPCYRFKPQTNLAVFEVLQIFKHGERKVCVRLNVIQELGVSLAIESPRFIRQSSGGLSLGPFPAVHNQHLIVAIGTDQPVSYCRNETNRLGADCF